MAGSARHRDTRLVRVPDGPFPTPVEKWVVVAAVVICAVVWVVIIAAC